MSSFTYIDYKTPSDLKLARTEFIIFVKDGDEFSPTVDEKLFQVYKKNPLFRKLSMVSPTISTSPSVLYGWRLANGVVSPQYAPSSTEAYAIQIGLITGSVIRRSALEKIDYEFSGSVIKDSILLSLALWESGNRIFIDPNSSKKRTSSLDNAFKYEGPEYAGLQKLFKREMIA